MVAVMNTQGLACWPRPGLHVCEGSVVYLVADAASGVMAGTTVWGCGTVPQQGLLTSSIKDGVPQSVCQLWQPGCC